MKVSFIQKFCSFLLSVAILIVITVSFTTLSVFTSSANQQEYDDTRYLLIIDSSRSTSLKGPTSLKAILNKAEANDEISRQLTIILYPTDFGPKLLTFRNSAEVFNFRSTLELAPGGTNMTRVFELAKSWSNALSEFDRKVLWITDGGSVAAFVEETDFKSELINVAEPKDWLVLDISPNGSARFLEQYAGTYFDSNSNLIELTGDFFVEKNLPLNLEPESFTQFSLSSILIFLAVLFAVGVNIKSFYALVFAKFLRSRRIKVLNFGKIDSDNSQIIDNFILWSLLPKTWTKYSDLFFEESRIVLSQKKKFIVNAAIVMSLSVLLTSVLDIPIFALLISIFITPLIFNRLYFFVKRKGDKKFREDLPGLLLLVSSGLRSGLSLEQSMDAYCQLNDNLLSGEFRRVLTELRMGSSLELALEELSKRRSNEDLAWLVTAISIQKNVGGSLSTIMDTVLETINGRGALRREVQTLSAEGRLSAYVLIALPLGIFAFLFASRREYVEVLWQDSGGIFILSLILFLITVGWVWMRKVVDIKV
jgi:Flp pilus assembly protein TadB